MIKNNEGWLGQAKAAYRLEVLRRLQEGHSVVRIVMEASGDSGIESQLLVSWLPAYVSDRLLKCACGDFGRLQRDKKIRGGIDRVYYYQRTKCVKCEKKKDEKKWDQFQLKN